MNKLKELKKLEIIKIKNRHNCCLAILGGISAAKAGRMFDVGTPIDVLHRWCKTSNEDGYKKIGYSKNEFYCEPSINDLRVNKHLFTGGKAK